MKQLLVTSLLTTSIMGASIPAMASDAGSESAIPRLSTAKSVAKESRINPAVGLSIGGSIGVAYDDNINKQKFDEQMDEIFIVRPELILRTDLADHDLTVRAMVENGIYSDHTQNNYTDADVRANFRYDINDVSALHNYARYRYAHIDIGALDDEPLNDLSEPTTYHYGQIGTFLERTPEDYKYQVGVEGRIYDYYDIRRTNGLIAINDDRDRWEGDTWARFGKYIQPAVLPYLEVRGNLREYREQVDSTATVARDSIGYAALVGVELGDKRATHHLDANIGVTSQSYDADEYDDVTDLAVNIKGFWQATPVLRLTADAGRSIEEVTNTGVSSLVRTRLKAGAEYQISPLLTVEGYARATENDFQASPSLALGRVDNIYDGGIDVRYQFSKQFAVGVGYSHTDRESDTRGDVEYNRNLFMVRLIAGDF